VLALLEERVAAVAVAGRDSLAWPHRDGLIWPHLLVGVGVVTV